MIRVTADIEIEHPSEAVFEYLANFENNPYWQRGMREARFTSEPPLRVGSTYDQVARFLGRRIVSSFEVVEFDPGRSITIATVASSFPIRVTRRVEPLESGRSRVTAEISGDAERVLPAGYAAAVPCGSALGQSGLRAAQADSRGERGRLTSVIPIGSVRALPASVRVQYDSSGNRSGRTTVQRQTPGEELVHSGTPLG